MDCASLESEKRFGYILRTRLDALTWEETLDRLCLWAARKESRYVCVCNVHSIVSGWLDHVFQRTLNDADMTTPDGAPLVWTLRSLGFRDQQRIDGPHLMWKLFAKASEQGIPVFLFGSEGTTLELLTRRCAAAFPHLIIAGSLSPPFRPLTPDEDEQVVKTISESGAGFVFVSLGCPKQERWMAAHRHRIPGVMLGVGAAFDFYAGTLKRAPNWLQRIGMEWLYRLQREPRRLWKRYLVTNSVFLAAIAWHFLRNRVRDRGVNRNA